MKIAKQIDLIAQLFKEETDPIVAAALIQERLFSYADHIRPWADQVARLMCERVAEADLATWDDIGKGLSKATKERLKTASVGHVLDQLQAGQVELITSLPREAAMKVHEWTRESLANGERYADLAERITSNLGDVTEARAICIARTETARCRSNFTQARAKALGSTHYIWRTVGDGATRGMHAVLDGTVQAWDAPPICERGKGGVPVRAHAGCVWNCRCYPEPIFEEKE